MLKTCIKCGKNIAQLINSAQARCSYCGYDFLKEDFVTIFPIENISNIHKSLVFSQVTSYSNRNKELTKLCQCINVIADNTYKDALTKIPISELFMMSDMNNFTGLSIIEIIKTTPIGDLKRLVEKCENDEEDKQEENNICSPRILKKLKKLGISIGSSIKFGSEKWKVIDIKDNCMWLMSERTLTKRAFNDKCIRTNWAECSLRQWLNDKFLYEFIGLSNVRYVLDTKIHSEKKEWLNWLKYTCNTLVTSDKVFVLSEEEFEKYKHLIDSNHSDPCVLRTSSRVNDDDFVLTYQGGNIDNWGVRVDYPVDVQPVIRLGIQGFMELYIKNEV